MNAPAEPVVARGSWLIDIVLAALVFAALIALRPLTPDGDGMYHSGRAIQDSLHEGMVAKHPFYAGILRLVHLSLDAVGLRAWTLEAFAIFSCLCGAGVYLVLVRGLYPPLIGDVVLSRLCALGTLASYGVMQCCCSIETYAPSLLFNVALVTVCLRWDIASPRAGVAAGLLFVLAVGMHASNVLLTPFLLTVLWLRMRCKPWTAAIPAVGAVLLGALFIATTLAGWPPVMHNLIPVADPEPTLGVAGRLGRAVYGWLRTYAWLPPSWELTKSYLIVYAISGLVIFGFIAYLARGHFSPKSRRGLIAMGALIAVPYFALGIKYYPSDPERWLFLVPMIWLFIGWIWADYQPGPSASVSRAVSRIILAAMVAALAVFNAGYKLWPEAHYNRDLTGLQKMVEVTKQGDIIVATGKMGRLVEEYILYRKIEAEFLPISDIMLKEYPTDTKAGAEALRQRVRGALQDGHRVYVFALVNEGLAPGRGFPWAHVHTAGYTPQTMLDVLAEFSQEEIVPATPDQTGTYRLHLR